MSVHWNDLKNVLSLQPDPVRIGRPTQWKPGRVVLDCLARCVPETWYSVGEFTAYVKAYATDFMRPDGNYERWAPRDAHTGSPFKRF